ncbi:MAG: DUF47 family protein [Candidatus Tectomicrobia bacterium]|uniref:DUF47 family protein n=1 Tax=Tectimicrobiota bacterium TaxID=2528274 RepID=A0A932GNQ0_UNCTE|nr:DUF47 family protein [Candidatus Tectomicrobia bacterium]
MWGKTNDKQFEDIFKNHIANTVGCAEELGKLFADLSTARERIQSIIEREHKGDDLTRQAHQLLDRTFITKIDKDDIVALINELDHVIDFMRAVAIRVQIYHITAARSEAASFTNIITQMTKNLQTLMPEILNPKLETVQKQVVQIKELEEEADLLLYRGLEHLFQGEPDAKTVIQWKDIFENLEIITDHCENVADAISSISRKEAR